ATSRNVAAGGAEEDDLDWYSPWGALSRKEESIDFDDFESARYFHSALWEWTTPTPQKRDAARHSAVAEFDRDQLKSPMPAKVIKILVEAGQKVKKGDLVVVLE